jgi:hypothetical protein
VKQRVREEKMMTTKSYMSNDQSAQDYSEATNKKRNGTYADETDEIRPHAEVGTLSPAPLV